MPQTHAASQPGKSVGVTFAFRVDIEGNAAAFFKECSGLGMTVAIEKYEEGGLNDYVHQLPGRTSHSNITLKQAVDTATPLYNWLLQIVRGESARKNLSIVLMDESLRTVQSWQLKNAFPVKWTGASMDAAAKELAIETIEIAHEGLVEV